MKIFDSLLAQLDRARLHVPMWSRHLVIAITVVLAVATFVHVPLAAIGVELPAWESFVFDTCGPFCHQSPQRSFAMAGHPFPLCARCTGMWLGITLGIAFAMWWVSKHRWWSGTVLTVMATAASGFDFLREQSGGAPSSWTRAVLGFLIFIGVTAAVSFDVLAVLAALGRYVRRLHRGR